MQYFRAAAMLAFIGLGSFGTWKYLNDPSWIQAIWSVIGVFLAFIFPGWQAQVSEDTRYRQRMNLLADLVSHANWLLTSAAAAGNDPNKAADWAAGLDIATWATARDALKEFPLFEARRPDQVTALIKCRTLMAEAVELIVGARTKGYAWSGVTDRIQKRRQAEKDSIERLLVRQH